MGSMNLANAGKYGSFLLFCVQLGCGRQLSPTQGWPVEAGATSTAGSGGTGGGVAQHGGQTSGLGGSGPAWAPDARLVESGTRLKAVLYTGGGTEVFRHFHDEKLGFDCEFVEAANGDVRCVPSTVAVLSYLDASCREPATFLDFGHLPKEGDWVRADAWGSAGSCPFSLPDFAETYRIGERVYDEQVPGNERQLVYGMVDSQCQVVTSRHGKIDPPVHRLIPVPREELVSARRQRWVASEQFNVVSLQAEDGASLTLGVETHDGAPCALQRDGRCVPHVPAIMEDVRAPYSHALDSSCSQPAYAIPIAERCGTPEYAVRFSETGQIRVHELAPANTVYSLLPGRFGTEYCTAVVEAPGTYFGLGADVTETLPQAIPVRLGEGPLWTESFTASKGLPPLGTGRPLQQQTFIDATGAPCQPVLAMDSTLRCLRTQNAVLQSSFWADADCTLRLSSLVLSADTNTRDLLEPEYTADGKLSGYHDLVPYSGPIYEASSGSCLRADPPEPHFYLPNRRSGFETLPVIEEVRRE
ncbi:MAG TPA: hypothetical protein VFQ61_09180 [Polyangiaceae bacterium]|nr:hypothetical protein [Polyangiaceae bacterium]